MSDRPLLSLSTSWNSKNHSDGYAMCQEIASLGFTHMELSHGIRVVLVPGILRAVQEGVIKVGTCHNFCPLPPGVDVASPNLFKPSAQEAGEFDQWVRYTKRSLDFAQQVGARLLVCHLGSLKFGFFDFDPAKKLEDLFETKPAADWSQDPAYVAQKEKTAAKLQARKGPYWQTVKKALEAVRTYALEKGIALGFENREALDELPLDPDFEEVIAGLTSPHTAGYWHDTGHAHIKEKMLFLKHREHLEKNAARLLGFHLHDVSDKGKDHQPIGSGAIDFEMISRFWRPEHLLVIELSPRVSKEGVLASKQKVEALLAARFPKA